MIGVRGLRGMKRGRRAAGEDKTEVVVANRRWFLAWAGTAAGGALLPASRPAEAAAPGEGKHALYRETEHIRRYYELAR